MHKLLDKDGAQHLVDKFLSDQGLQDNKLDKIEEKFDDLYSIVGIEHYGIKIDKNNSDTSARIVYTHDCKNYTPARMDYTNGVFEIGSWGNAFFMKNNYPAMCNFYGVEQYKFDPDDHSLKEDGTSSDVADETYNGNAMSVFDCHIWMKFWEDDNYQYLEVSNYKLDDDFKDYPYVRADGSKADKLYYPMYPGYVDSNNRLRSISGVKASSYTTTSQEVTYASNCGTNWSIGDWSHYLWLNSLMLLISKNLNSQEAFGNGNMISGSFATNGTLNTSGQFFGYSTATSSMKAFYCENVYANRDQRLLGFYNDKGTYKIKMVPPYTHNETFEGYTTVSTPTVSYPDGYVKDLAFDTSYGLLPKTVGGSSTTYVGDRFYVNNSQVDILLAGGGCSAGSDCGSWCLRLNVRTANVGSGYGASSYLTEPIHFDLNTIYGSSPIHFEQDNYAQPLADYTILGNSYQDGTPSPDMPVEVVGVGERTENLVNPTVRILDANISTEGIVHRYTTGQFDVGYFPIVQGNTYTIDSYLHAFYYNIPTIGSVAYDNLRVVGEYGRPSSFTAPITGYCCFRVASGYNFMANNGSTALPYEPYGYKLPLTCGGTEYPIYIGQVETTRRIKKLVFDGTENWRALLSPNNTYATPITPYLTNDLAISSHFRLRLTLQTVVDKTFMLAYGREIYMKYNDTDSVDDFKQFLAAQYAVGTPVTVWYVLAEPETGIVNEPLHKIGDYADTVSFAQASVTLPTLPGNNTLSVDTALQPSQISITGHIKEISQ